MCAYEYLDMHKDSSSYSCKVYDWFTCCVPPIKLGLLSPGNVTNGMDINNVSFNCTGHETILSNCVSSMEMCDSRTVARVDCSSGE